VEEGSGAVRGTPGHPVCGIDQVRMLYIVKKSCLVIDSLKAGFVTEMSGAGSCGAYRE
jgi:hypothetical protein